jgi:aminoglycoside phosphotransferase (APT) family kinase protein
MNAWRPEIVVDTDMAGRLIGQFAEVEIDTLRLLADGWDRAAWLVNEKWVFGFPRRAAAVPGIEREIQFLPRLAPLLPRPIPVPVFVGQPADGYPGRSSAAPFFPVARRATLRSTTRDESLPVSNLPRSYGDCTVSRSPRRSERRISHLTRIGVAR